MKIYLDYNATHPPVPEILKKNLDFYLENYGNPSGISHFSQKSYNWMEKNKNLVSSDLSLFSDEKISSENIHFVSTGTEALYQLVYSFADENDTVITSRYEHPAFLAACEDRKCSIEFLEADKTGVVIPEALEEKILELKKKNIKPSFVSAIGVSNETGIIQNAEGLSRTAKKYDIPFLADLIQAAGKIKINPSLYDGFALNGIKFGAGPGASLVYTRDARRTRPLFRGGSQEEGRRAGTENILSIANFADALHYQTERMDEKNARLGRIQYNMENFLENQCGAVITGKNSPRVSNTTFAILPPCDMDVLLIALDQNDIIINTGSSCKSRARKPTASLMYMGYDEMQAMRTIRISTGIFSTENESEIFMEKFFEGMNKAVKK